jgi:hypothetical protein
VLCDDFKITLLAQDASGNLEVSDCTSIPKTKSTNNLVKNLKNSEFSDLVMESDSLST